MSSPTEIARRETVQVNLGGPIVDLDQAMRAADILCKSDLLPRSLHGNAPNTLLVMLIGQELNLSLTQAFRTIYMPSGGQPQLRGVLVLARLRQAGHTYKFEETADSCTFTLIRGDTKEEYTGRFTVDDAVAAGLAIRKDDGTITARSRDGKPMPWEQYRQDMLMWRAVARGAIRGAPEVMLGFDIQGSGTPEPEPEVQLRPGTPAPPEPTGQAATDGQVEQVKQQLRQLNEEMRQVADEIARPQGGDSGEIARPEPEPDPHVGGIPADEPDDDRPTPRLDETLAGPAVDEVVDKPPTEAELRRDRAVLAGLFGEMGYDPKKFRANVLRACSMFVQRRITSASQLAPSELYELTDVMRELKDRQDELEPVGRMAEEVEKWEGQWREADPDGLEAYDGEGA